MDGFWGNMRVLVTGATGFVGSSLVAELLRRGARVVSLVRDWDPQSELIRSGLIRRTTVVDGALEDYGTLARAINEQEVQTVFHLGAQTIVGAANRDPLPTFEANVRGTYNLLEACRVHRGLVRRVLIASSDKAYGECDVLPYTEATATLGNHPYDVSKSCADLIAQAYHRTYELPVVIARCGNIYGAGDLNWSRIVPGTIASLYREQRPIIRSDGKFLRDYVFVRDAVDAYLLMAERAEDPAVRGEAFNFGPGRPLTVLQIVEAISRLMDKTHLEPVIQDVATGEIRDQYLDSSKARSVLGWEPRCSLEDGLKATISWYVRFLEEQDGITACGSVPIPVPNP